MNNKHIEEDARDAKTKRLGMYISLGVCVLALALGFWSAIARTNRLAEDTVQITTAAVRVERNMTDIPAQTTTKTPKTTVETTTQIDPVAEFFVMPVGGEITKTFSMTDLQYSLTYRDWRLHLGLDIAADEDTVVHAAGNGAVKRIYDDADTGRTVVIDHGNGITAYYCGLKGVSVHEGDVIEVASTVGAVGTPPNESVETPHLHFAVQKDGKWVDPVATLELNKTR